MGFVVQLRHHAARQPDHEAIVAPRVTLTYAELLSRVEAGAAGLAAAGLGSGMIVTLTITDEVEHLVASLALLAVGARQLSVASFDPPPVRLKLAQRIGATHIVASSPADTLEGSTFVHWPPSGASAVSLSPAEGTVFLRTSGTTGDSNLTEFTADQLEQQAAVHPDYAPERLLRLASIENNNSKRHRLYCVLRGGTNVFKPDGQFEVAAFCNSMGITCLDLARMHASGLAGTLTGRPIDNTTIRVAGGPTPFSLRQAMMRDVSSHLEIRYGATECGVISMAGPAQHDEDETVGFPLAGIVLEIVDAEGHPLPNGQTGEIRLKAPGMASGYFDSPEQTARRFRDGWFWPGDMGTLRADGQLIVEGRKDDMMILNGLNIFPAEIERVLEQHEAVSVAAALPLPSGVHGQIPVAAVELKPSATITAAELQAYARGHLALRAPRRILIVDALPRNPAGKILRRELVAAFKPKAGA